MTSAYTYGSSVYAYSGFTNQGNITGTNDATCTYSGTSGSEYVEVTMSIFSAIPDNAVISGIEATTWWSRSDSDDYITGFFAIYGKGSSSTYSFTSGGSSTNCTGIVQETEGSSSDMWGYTSLTGNDVNDSGDVRFRFTHVKSGKAGTVYIDAVKVTFYYYIKQACTASVTTHHMCGLKSSDTSPVMHWGVVDAWCGGSNLGAGWSGVAGCLNGPPDSTCASVTTDTSTGCSVQFGDLSWIADIVDSDRVLARLLTKIKVASSISDGEKFTVLFDWYETSWLTSATSETTVTTAGTCSSTANVTIDKTVANWGGEWSSSMTVGEEPYLSGVIQKSVYVGATTYFDSIYTSLMISLPLTYEQACTASITVIDKKVKLTDVTDSQITSVYNGWVTSSSGNAQDQSDVYGPTDNACMYVNQYEYALLTYSNLTSVSSDSTIKNLFLYPIVIGELNGGTEQLRFALYSSTEGWSYDIDQSPPYVVSPTCNSVSRQKMTYGGEPLIDWGYADGLLGSDINNGSFSAKVSTTYSSGYVMIDSIYLTVETTETSGPIHEYEYPTSAIGISVVKKMKPKMLESSAVGTVGALKNKPKTFQDGAISIAAAEAFPAYLKALAATMNIAPSEDYAIFHKEAAAVGLTTLEEYLAFKKLSSAISVSAVEKLNKAYFKYVAAGVDISESALYFMTHCEDASIGIMIDQDYLIKKLLATALALSIDEKYFIEHLETADVGITSIIQLEALKKTLADLGISADAAFPLYLKALAASIGIDGTVSFEAFLNGLAAAVGITAEAKETLAKLISIAIGIGAETTFPAYLKALDAAITTTGDIDFVVFIKEAFGVSIDGTVFASLLKALAASVSIDGSITEMDVLAKRAVVVGITTDEQFETLYHLALALSVDDEFTITDILKSFAANMSVGGVVSFEAFLNTLTITVGITGVIQSQVKKLLSSGISTDVALKSLVEIFLSSSIGITATEYLEKITGMDYVYPTASISIVGDLDFAAKKLLTTAIGIVAALENLAKIFQAAGINVEDSYQLEAKKFAIAGINIEDAIQSYVKKLLDADVGVDAVIQSLVKIFLSSAVGITATEYLEKIVGMQYVYPSSAVTITGDTATDAKKLITAAVNVSTTIQNLAKLFEAAGISVSALEEHVMTKMVAAAISIAASENFPAFKKALEVEILISPWFTTSSGVFAEASISVAATSMLEAIVKAAAAIDVEEATVRDVKKLIQLIIDIAESRKLNVAAFFVSAISVLPVWDSPEWQALLKIAYGQLSMGTISASMVTKGDLLIDGDLTAGSITETLDYTTPWDGMWGPYYFGGFLVDEIDAVSDPKTTGSYSIHGLKEDTTMAVPCLSTRFDSVKSLKGYRWIVVDVKITPQEWVDHIPVNESYIVLYTAGGPMGGSCYIPIPQSQVPTTTDWHTITVDLADLSNAVIYEPFAQDLSVVRGMSVYFGYDYVEMTYGDYNMYVDGLDIYSHDRDLHATMEQGDIHASLTTTGSVESGSDFITEALSYDVGEWWDGEWHDAYLGFVDYELESTIKKTGSYSIKAIPDSTPTLILQSAYVFESAPNWNAYEYMHFWIYLPIDVRGIVGNARVAIVEDDFEGKLRRWNYTSYFQTYGNVGWHELLVPIHANYTDSQYGFNLTPSKWIDFYIWLNEEQAGYPPIYMDDIYFIRKGSNINASMSFDALSASFVHDGTIQSDSDFMTDALSYNIGEWWDGAYNSQGIGGNAYALEGTTKKVGTYSIDAYDPQNPTTHYNFNYEFESTSPASVWSKYEYVSFWVYFPPNASSHTFNAINCFFCFTEKPFFQGMWGWDIDPATIVPGWVQYTFPIHHPDWTYGTIDESGFRMFEIYLQFNEEEYTYKSIYIDDLRFYSTSKELRATLTRGGS